MLEPKTVKKFENKLTEAIVEVVMRLGLKNLPILPSHQTMHLMAKAAVAVYEAAAEKTELDQPF